MSRVLWFAGGLAVAAAAAWFTRPYWTPPAVIVKPQVLTVGSGTAYPSIAAAMSAAHAGDVVEVSGGEYSE